MDIFFKVTSKNGEDAFRVQTKEEEFDKVLQEQKEKYQQLKKFDESITLTALILGTGTIKYENKLL